MNTLFMTRADQYLETHTHVLLDMSFHPWMYRGLDVRLVVIIDTQGVDINTPWQLRVNANNPHDN
jgi:hypothetical protein